MTYFNTTKLEGQDLDFENIKANSQEHKILAWMVDNDFKTVMPSQALKSVFSDKTPITSVRRAIHSLTSKGYLDKTTCTRPGMYGKPEHIWMIAGDELKQQELF